MIHIIIESSINYIVLIAVLLLYVNHEKEMKMVRASNLINGPDSKNPLLLMKHNNRVQRNGA